MTWSTPTEVWTSNDVLLIEPTLVKSPDGEAIAMLAGDASGQRGSFLFVSGDDGVTWSAPRELPAELDGVGHDAALTASGDLVVTLRADAPPATRRGPMRAGDWVAWIGAWSDLIQGTPGEGRVILGSNAAATADPSTSVVAIAGDGLFASALGAFDGGPFAVATGQILSLADLRADLALVPRRATAFLSAREALPATVHTYRTPAMAITASGMVVAAADARRTRGDELPGEIDLVLRRSADDGATFGIERVIYDDTTPFGVSQPVLSVDPVTGDLCCAAMQSFGASLANSNPGFGVDSLRNVVTRSANEGLGWTPPNDITTAVKDVFWSAAWFHGGAGLHTTTGRWLIPMEGYGFGALPCVHFGYSDDGGTSWGRLPTVAVGTMDPTVVERADGSLVVSVRQLGSPAMRAFFVSSDDGATWSPAASVEDPIERRSPSGFLVLSAAQTPTGDEWWILAGPSATRDPVREDLTVFVSRDQGQTWSLGTVLHRGPAGDATLQLLPSGDLGVLAEVGDGIPYERIDLIRVPLALLAD